MAFNRIKQIIRNDYMFSIISRIISAAMSIFHVAFLARFLGKELKGVSASITSIVAIGCLISTMGIHQAFPYYRKKDKSKEFLDKFCSTVVAIYSILFVISWIIYAIVSGSIVVKGSIILIPIFGYEMVIQYVYLVESPKKRHISQIISYTIETLLLLFFWLFLKPNNYLMLLGLSTSIILKSIMATKGLKFKLDFRLCDFKYVLMLVKFGFLPMIALLLSMLNSRIDVLMLNMYESVSKAQIGIYSVGISLADKVLLIPEAIREILLGKLVAGKQKEEVARACRMGTAIAFAISVFIMIFGKFVIAILYGSDYSDAYSITFISSIGTIFMVYIKMVTQNNVVHKKQNINALLLAISVIVNIVGNIIFIPQRGIVGAAIATLIGHFICGLCFIVYFVKTEKIHPRKLILIQRDDLRHIKKFIKK